MRRTDEQTKKTQEDLKTLLQCERINRLLPCNVIQVLNRLPAAYDTEHMKPAPEGFCHAWEGEVPIQTSFTPE
jgi:hypothetical protein